jgi:hypothetical protein
MIKKSTNAAAILNRFGESLCSSSKLSKISVCILRSSKLAYNGQGFAQLGYLLLCPTPPGCKLGNEMQKLRNYFRLPNGQAHSQ